MLHAASSHPHRSAITGIRFYVPTAEAIVRSSVCAVTSATIYERNLPKSHGLNDMRMGTVDRRLRCFTCRLDLATCQGHHGHLQLAAPVYHPYFVEHTYKTLRMVCYFCSALLSSGAVDGGKVAFKNLAKRGGRPARCCNSCGCPQPQWTRVKTLISVTWPPVTRAKLAEVGHADVVGLHFTPYHAWLILRRITPHDARALGFDPDATMPEALVLRTLLVPPPAIRPSIMASAGSRSMGLDDITMLLNDVVKANTALQAVMTAGGADDDYVGYLLAPKTDYREAAERLQETVDVYIREDPASSSSGRHSHGNAKRRNLAQRLKGKEGRVRANLSGKRVDHSARTVISPEAELDIDELGIPEHVAQTLTIRERVCPSNREALWLAVLAGPRARNGARGIVYADGTTINLETCTMRERLPLADGDEVERTLRDGDWVVFNRQPTLHKLSMLGFRVRVMSGRTFRLPVPVTTGFNADFDGDECNVFVPQDLHSRVEVQELMAVQHHMVTAQNSQVVASVKQDSLLGMYLLTLPGVALPLATAYQLVMALHYPRQSVAWRAGTAIQGTQVYALMLPPDMHFQRPEVTVVAGAITACTGLTKSALKHLVHYMWTRAPALGAQFVSDMQRLANAWLRVRGMSVGITDCVPTSDAVAHLAAMDAELRGKCTTVMAASLPSPFLEPILSGLLSSALNVAGSVCQDKLAVRGNDVHGSNNILAMVASGAKGSVLNIGQIMGVVGQQYVRGSRIKGRIPCFRMDDTSPEARGYVGRSYLQGLRPSQYFHHAMGGREGLVDTAVKTAETGYLQRKLIKGMETARVAHDGTVRNSIGEIVQFVYGGDGCDAARLIKTDLPLLALDDEGVVRAAAYEGEATRLRALRDAVWAALPLDPWRQKRDTDLFMPFHAPWLLDAVSPKQSNVPQSTSHHSVWMAGVIRRLPLIRGKPWPLLVAYVAWHFRHSVVAMCATRRLASAVVRTCHRALVAPSEMVGALAAQSCGEPATQMTLNTFHTSGVLHDIMQGVPRLKELLNVTPRSKPKTPVMRLHLKPPLCYTEASAMEVAQTLPVTLLHHLVTACTIADVPIDDFDAAHAAVFPDLDAAISKRALHLHALVFSLDADAMVTRRLTPTLVACRLAPSCPATPTMAVHLITGEWWLRVRVSNTETRKRARAFHDELPTLRDLQRRLLNCEVCGMHGIHAADVATTVRHELDAGHALQERCVYTINTHGVNLGSLGGLPFLDQALTTTNDVVAIAEAYGLEAATKALFYEIRAVLSPQPGTLHDRHIMMIVDTMTHAGGLMPMNRHGMNKRRTGPLVRSSFEETVDVFIEAAVFGERDSMAGVSDNIMAGQLAPLGTGCVEVLADQPQADHQDGDVAFSVLGDHVDADAVQLEPAPFAHALVDDVPSLPCEGYDPHKPALQPVVQCQPLGVTLFVYTPRSPTMARSAGGYVPRSPSPVRVSE